MLLHFTLSSSKTDHHSGSVDHEFPFVKVAQNKVIFASMTFLFEFRAEIFIDEECSSKTE